MILTTTAAIISFYTYILLQKTLLKILVKSPPNQSQPYAKMNTLLHYLYHDFSRHQSFFIPYPKSFIHPFPIPKYLPFHKSIAP